MAKHRAGQFVETVNRHGEDAQLLVLPEIGIYGNTHAAFSDLNNLEIADLLENFFKKRVWMVMTTLFQSLTVKFTFRRQYHPISAGVDKPRCLWRVAVIADRIIKNRLSMLGIIDTEHISRLGV